MSFARVLNLWIVGKVISRNLFIVSGALMVAGFVGFLYSEQTSPFVFSSFITFTTGLTLYFVTQKHVGNSRLQIKEAYLIVALSWLTMSLAGSLPYLFSKSIPTFVDSFFESVSGFTTTGSSILTDIEVLPKSILFWRSMTHWVGGIGIIVLVIIVMPALQIGGYHLFTLESSLQEKIQPKIKSVGTRLLLIYLSLTFAEVLMLLFGGMDLFESVCHAFGTIATGGFSPRNSSIGGYSAYIQYVIMAFMLLSGTSFVIHYYLIKREFRKVKDNEELRFYLFIVLSIGLVISSILFFKMGKPIEVSFREGFFQVISIITCTGFATADYLCWPEMAWVIIFLSMFIGGSTGSTAGGIKIVRHLVVFKNLFRVFKQLVSPNAVVLVQLNKKTLSDETNNAILTFIVVYLLVYIAGSVFLVALGIDAKTAGSAAATCMAGIGPGLGSVGPAGNFAHLPDLAKMALTFLMLAGRLEIYTILVLFTQSYWTE